MTDDKNTGIREYERIRKYMEHIYLFGFLNGDELAELKGYSKKDYDRMLPFMERVLPFDIKVINKKNYRSIKRIYGEDCDRNSLTDSYMLRAIKTDTHLVQYLLILSKASKGKEKTFCGLCNCFEDVYYNLNSIDYETLDEEEIAKLETKFTNTIRENCRNRLDELVNAGYLIKENKIYNPSYKVRQAELVGLTATELEQLYNYVGFISKISCPKVAGSFLYRTLERELFATGCFKKYYRKTKKEAFVTPYIIRNNSNHNIFDEELVYQLFDAILTVKEDNDSGYKDIKIVKLNGKHFIPMGLRYDSRFGRWYVWGATKNDQKGNFSFTIYSLTTVSSIEINSKSNESWEVKDFCKEIRKITRLSKIRMWSGRKNPSQKIEAKLLFDEEDDGQLAKIQFERERFFGEIAYSENIFKAKLCDPVELLPWLRSFSPWLKVIPSTNEETHNYTKAPNEKALDVALYESLSTMRDTLLERKYPTPDPKILQPNKSIKQEPGLFNRFQSQNMQFVLELLCRLSCGPLSYSEILHIASEDFCLRYRNIKTVKQILDFLEKSEYITCDNKIYCLGNENIPKMFLGDIESDYLCYIMSLPEADLFLSDDTKDKIKKNLVSMYEKDVRRQKNLFLNEDNVLPVWSKYIEVFSPNGEKESSRIVFNCVLNAIKRGNLLKYRSEKSDLKSILAWKIEYNANDRTFWIIGYDIESKSIMRILMKNIVFVENGGRVPNCRDEFKKVLSEHKIRIKLLIIDRFNALKRTFLMFENEEIVESQCVGAYQYELVFDIMDFYKEELIRKLMYLGENVVLIEAPKEIKDKLLEKIEKALSNNSKI